MLVSNFGQPDDHSPPTIQNFLAQGFTTGTNQNGYTLTSIDFEVTETFVGGTVRLATQLPADPDAPGEAIVATLTNPATLTPGIRTFTAPSGTTLSPNTTYYVILKGTTGRVRETPSNHEDASGQAGWSIADDTRWRSNGGTIWRTHPNTIELRVNGSASSDPLVTIAPRGSPVREGSAAAFTVTATQAPSADLTVNLNVSEATGSAFVASGDEGSKTVTIPAGSTTATYSVPTQNDSTDESNGSMTVQVQSGTGYLLGAPSSATVAVHDDDVALPTGISGATIDGRKVTVTTTGNRGGCPLSRAWTIKLDGKAIYGHSSSCTGNSVNVWLSDRYPPARIGTKVTLSYDKGWVQEGASALSSGGTQVANFTDMPVTNETGHNLGVMYGTPPVATVDGKVMTLTFGKTLVGFPEPGEIEVTSFPNCGGLCAPTVTEVSWSNRTATLTLDHAIRSHAEATVRYRGVAGNELRPFLARVTVQTADAAPALAHVEIEQSIRPENQYMVLNGGYRVEDLPPVERYSKLVIDFTEQVDPGSLPPGSAFTVTARPPGGGSAVTVSGTGTVNATGSTIGVSLAEPVARDAVVTASYDKPSANALRDRAGNEVASFSGVSATNFDGGSAAPEIVSQAVVSDAGSDRTYRRGEKIRVQLTFSGVVHVTGTPRLRISQGNSHWQASPERGGAYRPWLDYESGSGTRTLTFVYTVKELDRSRGIAVLNQLDLNGGSIDSWGEYDVDLSFSQWTLNHDRNHKVDGASLAVELTGVEVVSNAGADKTYGAGEKIQVQVNFSTAVEVTGTPRLKIKMDPSFGEKWAVYESGSGESSLIFAYTVELPNISTQGIAVLADTLELNGGTIRTPTEADAPLAHAGLAHDENHKVDHQVSSDSGPSGQSGPDVEPVASVSVTGVSVVSDAGADKTYGDGDKIRVQVTFSQLVVDVTGTPRIKIDMDPAHWGEKWASYESGGGTHSLTFVHTVAEPNLSTQGIAVLANTLELNGGTIRSGGEDASLAHTGLAHDSNHKVDWQTAGEGSDPVGLSTVTAPTVTGVSVVSSPASGGTYMLGETIRIRATFDQTVQVIGSPRLSIDMDPAAWGTKQAAYEKGGGTTSLDFAYTVVEPNYSTQGIAVLANTLALNGGTIRSADTHVDAELDHTGLGHNAAHKVDWRPSISAADARVNEGAGAAVAFQVSLNRAFTTAGHRVTVDYATADGSAKAGEDYTAASGTLTFAAGETSKSVSVTVLDDAHDEGAETLTLRLSNAAGATINDGEATGTIENSDPMPKAWLARFGRTGAVHVVDILDSRFDAAAPTGDRLVLGGRAVDTSLFPRRRESSETTGRPEGDTVSHWMPEQVRHDGEEAGDTDPHWMPEQVQHDGELASDTAPAGEGQDATALERALWQALTQPGALDMDKRFLSQSSFHLSLTDALRVDEPDTEAVETVQAAPEHAGHWSLWGQGALTRFQGAEDDVNLDGEVLTGLLGLDYARDRWLAGVALAYHDGDGGYRSVNDDTGGDLDSTLITVNPYLRYALTPRLSVWGTAGLRDRYAMHTASGECGHRPAGGHRDGPEPVHGRAGRQGRGPEPPRPPNWP